MEKYISNIKDLVIQALTNGSEIKAKAESGDALSCFQMGMINLLGIDTPIDFNKANKYLGSKSLADNPDANRLLGFIAECEGNYSLAFKKYTDACKAIKPYINKVYEERGKLNSFFQNHDLPTTIQNRIVTEVINGYLKGNDTKVDASIRIALICNDETSCINAAQALYNDGDFFSALRWLQNGKVPENNSLYTSIMNKISDSKSSYDLPNIVEIVEIEDSSLLTNFGATQSYAGIKKECDKMAISCKKEWNEAVPLKIALVRKEVEEEAAQKKKLMEEAAKREETARKWKLLNERNRQLLAKKKVAGKIVNIILAIIFVPIAIFLSVMISNNETEFLMNCFGILICCVLPCVIIKLISKSIIDSVYK